MGHPKDPKSWKLKRNRDGDTHRTNNGSHGYVGLSTFSNVHHIVCISSMANGTIEGYVTDKPQYDFIQNCLAETPWDINSAPNLVGLPKKGAYVDPVAPKNWDTWPCHQVDHPSYLEKVSDRLNENVWTTCQDVAQDCKLKGQAIASQLKTESSYWLGKLSGRPTKQAWDTRFNADGTPNPLWFWPFSMDSDDPSPRQPPPDWTKQPGVLGTLSEIFAML